jgi:predicted hotdog family 3-hydroxylacyl-ACP dehydratase
MSLMGREMIATLIPHGGNMCLLDELLAWDDAAIICLSRRYRGADNPLRRKNGTLGMACGIEMAAQAMALHGRLAAGGLTAGTDMPPGGGMLASVRDVRFGAAHLDAGTGDLTIAAERLLGDSAGATYHFSLICDDIEVLSGRATVLLEVKK